MRGKRRNPDAVERESSDFERLKKAGFEFRSPVDEYSYQPGSSGVIGGTVGADEYGIGGGVASENSRSKARGADDEGADVLTPDPIPVGAIDDESTAGTSNWSMEQSGAEEGEGYATSEQRRQWLSSEFDRPDTQIE